MIKMLSLFLVGLILAGTGQRSCQVRRHPNKAEATVPSQKPNKSDTPTPEQTTEPSKGKMLTAEEIAQTTLLAVVLITCDGLDSSLQGSGFFIRSGMVITNHHVVDQCGGIDVEFLDSSGQKRRTQGSLLASDADADLAVIVVPVAETARVHKLEIAEEAAVVGETVFAAGNPKGLERTFSPGIVSADLRMVDSSTRLQITAPISQGSSGGPVVNSRGNVVGVAVSSVEGGQNLNFAVPAILIKKFIYTLKQ